MGIIGTAFWLVKWAVFIAVSIVIVYTGIGIMRSESFASSSNSPFAETPAVAGDAVTTDLTVAQKVVRAFMKELDRIPSEEELRHYVDMFASTEYDDNRMTTLLQGSEEYTRRMKMQSNMVNADNIARITEREAEGIIRKAYVDEYGQNPSADTQAYLHARFINMDMNQNDFAQFLKRLHAAEQGTLQSYVGLAAPRQGTPQTLATSQQQSSNGFAAPRQGTTQALVVSQQQDSPDGLAAPRQGSPQALAAPQQQSSSSGQRVGAAKHCLDKRDTQGYAQASQQRRRDDLSAAAGRCTDQQGSNAGMVLLPGMEWSVPQPRPPVCLPCPTTCPVQPSLDQTRLLGTLLSDANDTQVGSMMPKFTYHEE
jgi:hypothetical protein